MSEATGKAVVHAHPQQTLPKLAGAILFFAACSLAGWQMKSVVGYVAAVGSAGMAAAGTFAVLHRFAFVRSKAIPAALASLFFVLVLISGLVVTPWMAPSAVKAGSFARDTTSPAVAGKAAGAPEQAASMQLSAEEQAEVVRIKVAGKLAGEMGHEIAPNTLLTIGGDNFGENPACLVHVLAYDPTGKVARVHGKWALVVQVGGGKQNVVWTNNALSETAGEVRLFVGDSGRRYALTHRVSAQGRGAILDNEMLAGLLASRSAKALSGVIGNTEVSFMYELTALPKAYKYANAICGAKT